jgi:hypothetical protein
MIAHSSIFDDPVLLLRRNDRFLARLGDPHLYHSLGGNIDLFTRGWISPHTSLTFNKDKFTNAGECEGSSLLGFIGG